MVLGTTVDAGCGGAFYPLSPMQQGMLFHRVNGGGSGVDVEQVIGELQHEVSAPEFIEACQTIVRRHDTFRTRFVWQEGSEPRQAVEPAEQVILPVRVLNFANEADIERILEEYLASDRRAGFASLAAPLARVALFQGGGSRAWFVFTYHHLVLDARGMCILFKELLDVHDTLVAGRMPELPAIHSYGEYIAWLQTLDTRRAEEFWREQLRGFATPTLLPLPQPAEALAPGDDAPGELVMRLTSHETARLRETAKRCDVTLNTVVQAAWAIVLSRYTGENDVIFGAVRACRHVPVEGAANMAGMLINTVPLRVRLAGAASLSHWLRGLREQWVALRDYEHTPLARTQQWSDAPAGRPLFDTLLNFQEPSWSEALRRLGGIWEKRNFEKRSQPNYPLALDVHGDEALLVRAFYDRRRFAADGLARLLQHFRTALLALAEPRLDTLAEVSLLDDAERARVLGQFNATMADYPREVCAHVLFEAQAAATPHRIAVADAVTTLTYGELNRRANRLARRLQAAGVGPDVAVAVGMRRSAAMLVAWLGVLKAGGAFVPLDPDYPAERLAYQISDCGAPVVITSPDTMDLLPPSAAGAQHVVVSADGNGFETEADGNLDGEISSDHLAYIIYTSGSTGQPKGVEVEHRALLNLVTWHQRTYALTPLDRATQVASPAFDASVWEVWPYLTCGASVHIPDEETRISPPRLWRWLATERITVAFLPTPLAEAAMAEPVPQSLALRVLLTGGDQLKRGVPPGFPCELVNHYGPTESTVVATAAVVSRHAAGAPPIGRPIANTQVYVLDRDLHPAPIGVPGELFIGGESLARGYRNRPDLTAEKFITLPLQAQSNPLGYSVPGSVRVYRTGDLVRWRADGQLEFIGRLDHQVKIRGCRIELGEIEAALQRQPAVREAVVLARPDEQGTAQLHAYVVPAAGFASTEGELTEFLRGALPSYMLPSTVTVLEAWPLTPNGKIDRKALPAPVRRGSVAFAPPSTPEEQVIATTWAEVLGRSPVGLHDNFFELGGHSLLAAQAITRLNAAFSTSISVRMLFDHPTVEEFASALQRSGEASAPRLPVLRSKRRTPSPELELVQPR